MEEKKFLIFASHLISFGLAIDLFIIFVVAWLNDFQTHVFINKYGEAHIELILFPVTLIFCFVGLFLAWKDMKGKFKEKKQELQERVQRGREITEQKKAEHMRKKSLGPGTIRYGLMSKQGPLDFMKDAYERRKRLREEKKKHR